MDEDEIAEHELALGGTRPALVPGINMPWPDFVVFFIASAETLIFHRPQFLIVIGAAFLVSLRFYRRDYNAGRVLLCWLETSGRHATRELGGTFISPGPGDGFRGIPG